MKKRMGLKFTERERERERVRRGIELIALEFLCKRGNERERERERDKVLSLLMILMRRCICFIS
jgi:hypothetical protein